MNTLLLLLDWSYDSFTRKRSLAWFVRNGANGQTVDTYLSHEAAAGKLRAWGYEHTTDMAGESHAEVWTKQEVSK